MFETVITYGPVTETAGENAAKISIPFAQEESTGTITVDKAVPVGVESAAQLYIATVTFTDATAEQTAKKVVPKTCIA